MYALRIKTSITLLLLLFNILFISSGMVKGFNVDSRHPNFSLHKDGSGMKNKRKMLTLGAVLDYDYAGPNPKHDPRKKKPGGGKP